MGTSFSKKAQTAANFAIEEAKIQPADVILDFGVKDGSRIPFFLKKLTDKGIIYGIDTNVDTAKKKYQQAIDDKKLILDSYEIKSPMADLPFKDVKFDLIFSSLGVYEWEKHDEVLKATLSWLKTGGKLVILGVSDSLSTKLKGVKEFKGTFKKVEDVKKAMTDAGFNQVDVKEHKQTAFVYFVGYNGEPRKVEEKKTEESKTEEKKSEETKPEEKKPEEKKEEEKKPEEPKPEEKKEESKPEEEKA